MFKPVRMTEINVIPGCNQFYSYFQTVFDFFQACRHPVWRPVEPRWRPFLCFLPAELAEWWPIGALIAPKPQKIPPSTIFLFQVIAILLRHVLLRLNMRMKLPTPFWSDLVTNKGGSFGCNSSWEPSKNRTVGAGPLSPSATFWFLNCWTDFLLSFRRCYSSTSVFDLRDSLGFQQIWSTKSKDSRC